MRPWPLPPAFVMVADPGVAARGDQHPPGTALDLPVWLRLGRPHDGDEDLPVVAPDAGLRVTWVPHDELTGRFRDWLAGVHGWYRWACVDTAQIRAIKVLLRAAAGTDKCDGHAMGCWTEGRSTG